MSKVTLFLPNLPFNSLTAPPMTPSKVTRGLEICGTMVCQHTKCKSQRTKFNSMIFLCTTNCVPKSIRINRHISSPVCTTIFDSVTCINWKLPMNYKIRESMFFHSSTPFQINHINSLAKNIHTGVWYV